jgi:hypothetical protein
MSRNDISFVYIAPIYVPQPRPDVNPASPGRRSDWTGRRPGAQDGRREVRGIQQRSVHVPREVYEALQGLCVATGTGVEEQMTRALRAYLDGEGHRAAVVGFADRARERHRIALDKLAET